MDSHEIHEHHEIAAHHHEHAAKHHREAAKHIKPATTKRARITPASPTAIRCTLPSITSTRRRSTPKSTAEQR